MMTLYALYMQKKLQVQNMQTQQMAFNLADTSNFLLLALNLNVDSGGYKMRW